MFAFYYKLPMNCFCLVPASRSSTLKKSASTITELHAVSESAIKYVYIYYMNIVYVYICICMYVYIYVYLVFADEREREWEREREKV